jgi:hypothetical protein
MRDSYRERRAFTELALRVVAGQSIARGESDLG